MNTLQPPHGALRHTTLLQHTGIDQGLVATRAEVRSTTQGAEDVTDVVAGLDTGSKGAVPVVDDTLDNLDTCVVNVLHGRLVRSRGRVQQVLARRLAGVGTVKVGRRAHDDDAREVGEVELGRTDESLQGGVVLLGAGAVVAGAVGQQGGVVGEGLTQDVAAVVDIAGGDITLDNGGGGRTSGVDTISSGVVGAVGLGVITVGQGGVSGKGHRQLAQVVIDLEHLGTVDVTGVLPGVVGALGEVAGGRVGGHLADVNLVLQGDLDGIASKVHTADGGLLGVDTGDTSDEEVGVGQVKQRVEDNGGDRNSGVDLGLAGDELADAVVGSTVDIREDWGSTRDGDVVGEQVELGDPPPDGRFRLELGGLVACRGSGDEPTHHGHDKDLGGDLLGGLAHGETLGLGDGTGAGQG